MLTSLRSLPADVAASVSPSDLATSRRGFLKASALGSTALIIATYLPFASKAQAATPNDPPMPNAFIKIDADSTVTVIVKHLDKGQGITTGLATIVADELDADWAQMTTTFAPADAKLYNNLMFGPVQGTGGSTSTANSWMQLRRAAAAARTMLVATAAKAWNVPASEITVKKGVIAHGTAKTGHFGDFAAAAAALPIPTDVKLKDPKHFTLIGTRVPRLDSVIKTTGKAIYSLDIRRPGMKTAAMMRPTHFGSIVKSVNDADARKIAGVIDVVTVPQGVAVIAENSWAAMQGRDALKVEWDDSKAEKR
ncbi:MAG TPA: molybdopterin cofactor-binding domain-containing protein, partial [Dongiaceae bacterium]|nr:molybdopterin cofactor-binding domain-containing protein [Dongiaceae bacterium]